MDVSATGIFRSILTFRIRNYSPGCPRVTYVKMTIFQHFEPFLSFPNSLQVVASVNLSYFEVLSRLPTSFWKRCEVYFTLHGACKVVLLYTLHPHQHR